MQSASTLVFLNRYMKKSAHSLFIALLFSYQLSLAQDWHFSQFHSSPVVTNPAFTGLFNGDLRVIGNFKEQWSFAAPYQTFSLSADGAIFVLKNGDFASGGFQIIGDRAGDLDYSTLQTGIDFSYSKALSGYGNHFLTIGGQYSFNRRSVNYANIVSFDPEPFALTADDNFTYSDLAVGGSWYFLPSDEIYIFAGLSYFHFNEPNQSFLKDESDVLEPRLSGQAGLQFPISDDLNLLPSVIYNTQGPHKEFVGGTYLKYKINHVTVQKETAMYAGLWYRNNDALIASLRFDHNNYYVGLSYDINTSTLTNASYGRGGLELNFIYILDKKFSASKRMKNRSYQCPKF